MIALLIPAFMAGTALGYVFAGMVAAGRREDDCRACRGEKAFRVEDEWRDGTE